MSSTVWLYSQPPSGGWLYQVPRSPAIEANGSDDDAECDIPLDAAYSPNQDVTRILASRALENFF